MIEETSKLEKVGEERETAENGSRTRKAVPPPRVRASVDGVGL